MTKAKQAKAKSPTVNENHAMILWPFETAAETGDDELARYLVHVGITSADIGRAGSAKQAILNHYCVGRNAYNIDAAARDLANYPPVAKRIAELSAQQKPAKGANRAR